MRISDCRHVFPYWVALSAWIAVLCILLMHSGLTRRLDMMYLDYVSPWIDTSDSREVMLVAVDERTAQALNGWPLKAEHYAVLIDQLTAYEVGTIALMLPSVSVASETIDHPLANSIGRNGNLVTIVLPSRAWTHGGINPDARTHYVVCESAKIVRSNSTHGECDENLAAGSPRYSIVSALDIMDGKIPRRTMKGRVVVVGSTLSDHRHWKPALDTTNGCATTAQLLAREISALTDDALPHIAGPWGQSIFIVVIMAALCAILRATGPTASLMATVLLASGAAFSTFMVLRVGHRFLFPSPVVLACFITYTSWTWWRQRALMRYVSREAAETAALNLFPGQASPVKSFDHVFQRIRRAFVLNDNLRCHALQASKWVNNLSEATLVASPDGSVVLANKEATRLASRARNINADLDAKETLVGLPVAQVLFAITSSHKAMNFAKQAVDRLSALASYAGARPADGSLTEGVELVDGDSRQLLIKYAAVPDFSRFDCALVFDITDVTHIRKVELQRDVMFRFMSHDLRSRQAAILALVEQMRLSPPGLSNDEFRERVAQCGTAALTMVDDFLFLARAESQVAKLASIDMALLLGDAIDDQWPQAKAKDIKVVLNAEPGRLVFGDVQLLRRTFENVLSNAVKFSFRHETIRVEIGEHRDMWQVGIIDNGVGMTADQTQEIYREFVRAGDGDHQGYGLGLNFVKRVVDSMGGQISIQSVQGIGTTVIVRLPKFMETPGHGAALP